MECKKGAGGPLIGSAAVNLRGSLGQSPEPAVPSLLSAFFEIASMCFLSIFSSEKRKEQIPNFWLVTPLKVTLDRQTDPNQGRT